LTANPEFQELQDRLQKFSENVPGILRRSHRTDELADEIERMLPSSKAALSEDHFTLAVAGQMRVGKSTLINAMIGADLAIPGVTETTATVNWFRHGTPAQASKFRVVWNDAAGSSDLIEIADKLKWSGSSELAARTRYLEFFSPTEFLKKVNIVDTPGTRSTFDSHEKAARGFLLAEGKAEKDTLYYGGITDCVAYVLPPVTRQNDSEVLGQFAAGSRLPQSTPFNSVGLLHKWEIIQHATPWTEAARQAGKAFQALKQYVCDVFPVSGPLGRACRVCPPAFWDDVLDFARGTTPDASELLTVEESWFTRPEPGCPIAPEKRAEMRTTSQLPWPCFKTVLLFAVSRPFASSTELLSGVREISGIDRLLEFLERRFFDRSRLIRSSTVLCRALRITDRARGRIRNRLDELLIDRKLAQQALDEIGGNVAMPKSRAFVARHFEDACKEHEQLSAILRDLDEQTVAVRASFECFEKDCVAVQYLDDHAGEFEPNEVVEILTLLGAYDGDAAGLFDAAGERGTEAIHDRFDHWLILQQQATGERRQVLDQVVARLERTLLQT
jgi:hypothetical protein